MYIEAWDFFYIISGIFGPRMDLGNLRKEERKRGWCTGYYNQISSGHIGSCCCQYCPCGLMIQMTSLTYAECSCERNCGKSLFWCIFLSRHEVNMPLKVEFKLTVFDGYNSMLKNGTVAALLTHIVINLYAKFEVYSFNRSRDIRGSQNSTSESRDRTWRLLT